MENEKHGMPVWEHSGTLVRSLAAVCLAVGAVLTAVGPGLCTSKLCCRSCYFLINGRISIPSADKPVIVHLHSPLSDKVWAIWVALALNLVAFLACVFLLALGLRASCRSQVPKTGLVNGVCLLGALSCLIAGGLSLLWSIGHYHNLGNLIVRGWLYGAVCVLIAAVLFIVDASLAFCVSRDAERQRLEKFRSLYPALYTVPGQRPPGPALSESDTQEESPVVSSALELTAPALGQTRPSASTRSITERRRRGLFRKRSRHRPSEQTMEETMTTVETMTTATTAKERPSTGGFLRNFRSRSRSSKDRRRSSEQQQSEDRPSVTPNNTTTFN